jgi:hypothetical protein
MQWLVQRVCFSKHHFEIAFLTVLPEGIWAYRAFPRLPSSLGKLGKRSRSATPIVHISSEFLLNLPRRAITQVLVLRSSLKSVALLPTSMAMRMSLKPRPCRRLGRYERRCRVIWAVASRCFVAGYSLFPLKSAQQWRKQQGRDHGNGRVLRVGYRRSRNTHVSFPAYVAKNVLL